MTELWGPALVRVAAAVVFIFLHFAFDAKLATTGEGNHPVSNSVRSRPTLSRRLPGHETVYAITVHKSQGSEFEHVLLVLPEKEAPVLTRELLYTGLTRARMSVRILGDESVLRTAVETQAQRFSGLTDGLCSAARGVLLEAGDRHSGAPAEQESAPQNGTWCRFPGAAIRGISRTVVDQSADARRRALRKRGSL